MSEFCAEKSSREYKSQEPMGLSGQTLVKLGDDFGNPALDLFHFLGGEGGGVIVEAAVVGDAFTAHPDEDAVLPERAVYAHTVYAVGGVLGGRRATASISAARYSSG